MGLEVDREHFTDADYAAFDVRLRDCLEALRTVLARPEFGAGPMSLGAEVELDLIDADGMPCPRNEQILQRVGDPRVTLEIDQFNLEINASPVALAGAPFTAIGGELDELLARIGRAAAPAGGHPIAVGILPTLRAEDLQSSALLTDRRRYRALGAGLRRLRKRPFAISIQGIDELAFDCEDVTIEGANTSLQIHLRVAPSQFAATHQAAQLATAIAVAVSGNSPLLLGKRLWEETRIALFRQAVDDRHPDASVQSWRPARVSFGQGWVRCDAWEQFAESVALYEPLLPVLGPEDPRAALRAGKLPTLAELRLHHGTVWQWNRAIYDDADGGHLRIELRALPSGPTVRDMMANAAFHVGLTLALAPVVDRWLPGLPFAHALRNFYAAARHGLGAELLWPASAGERVEPVPARALADRLLPMARRGLVEHGVAASEADRHLAVIADRIANGQTGSVWQRRVFEGALRGDDVLAAAQLLTRTYADASATGAPVHTWPLP